MSAKRSILYAVLLTLSVLGTVRGQEPERRRDNTDELCLTPRRDGDRDKMPLSGQTEEIGDEADQPRPVTVVGPPGALSSWISYQRPDCCGPVGGHGPIFAELYARTGPYFPCSGGILKDLLEPGWWVEGGGRSLFFNTSLAFAWTADFSISHSYNHATGDRQIITPVFIQPSLFNPGGLVALPVTLRTLQRTFANGSLGFEWYLAGTANGGQASWRVGFDAGGRWGSSKADFREIQHLTSTDKGPFGAIHTDVEIPCSGCCTFVGGLRSELDYIYSNILRDPNNSNLGSINLLINLGVRF